MRTLYLDVSRKRLLLILVCCTDAHFALFSEDYFSRSLWENEIKIITKYTIVCQIACKLKYSSACPNTPILMLQFIMNIVRTNLGWRL